MLFVKYCSLNSAKFCLKNFEWFNRYSCASSGVYRIIYGLANKFVTRKRS